MVSGGVLFPIVALGSATPSTLPDPVEAWGLAFGLTAGLEAQLADVAAPVRLAGAILALTPSRLVGLTALQGRTRQRYGLWTTPDPPPALKALATYPDVALPQPGVTLDFPIGSAIGFTATPTTETVLARGLIDAVVDRPVAADGSRIALAGPALAAEDAVIDGRRHRDRLDAVAQGPDLHRLGHTERLHPRRNSRMGWRSSARSPPTSSPARSRSPFPPSVVIPTLPDPYAARYIAAPAEEHIIGAGAVITWSAVAPVTPATLSIELINASTAAAANALGAPATTTTAPSDAASTLASRDVTTAEGVARAGVAFALLDVSSHEDQWGIAVTEPGVSQLSFSGLELQAPSLDTLVFTVPGISWEPVVDGTAAVPAWFAAFAPNDGTPTTFLVSTGNPVPLIPVEALVTYQKAAGTAATHAGFTLPFGITASMVDGPNRATSPGPGSGPPSYLIPAVTFPEAGMRGATVLSLRGGGPDPLGMVLPGSATVGTFSQTNPASDSYGALVMGATPVTLAPADFWNQEFGAGGKPGGIPVARIDLSGYGTSMFSDWRDPHTNAVGVVRANFSVLQGRTAHELVQFQTWIVPWSIRMQRTVVFDRSDGGEVVRHDTGWKAVDVGKFELLQPVDRDGRADRPAPERPQHHFSRQRHHRGSDHLRPRDLRRRCRL